MRNVSGHVRDSANDASLFGIMAIENTIAGSLLQNHELLRQSNLSIIGELKLRISHVIASLPGQTIDELSEVNSHPMALRAMRTVSSPPSQSQNRRAP